MIPQLLDIVCLAHPPVSLLVPFPLGIEARGYTGVEGVAEILHHPQLRVVFRQLGVHAGRAAGREVGSLAERAAAAGVAAAAPPGRHHLEAPRPIRRSRRRGEGLGRASAAGSVIRVADFAVAAAAERRRCGRGEEGWLVCYCKVACVREEMRKIILA